jgi:hypothetical protein
VTDLAYVDVRPVLAKVADLERELVLVGGQAVNFWASYYEARVPELASEAPFTSKDIDFCGDQRAVRVCAERLGGTPRVATFDDATPNTGTVVFVDGAGVTRTLDIVSAPYGLDAAEVHATALPVEILDDAGASSGVRFYVMHPVLCMESRVHNVVGLPGYYDTDQGRKQLRASILFAREFLRDVLNGAMDAEDPSHAVMKLDERIFRFATRDRHAKELYRAKGIDPAAALIVDPRLSDEFRTRRYPQAGAPARSSRCGPCGSRPQ